jgi:hypothetical protein
MGISGKVGINTMNWQEELFEIQDRLDQINNTLMADREQLDNFSRQLGAMELKLRNMQWLNLVVSLAEAHPEWDEGGEK